MACRLFGAKPLPEPLPTYCQLEPSEQNFSEIQNTKLLVQENVFENIVCEMAAILSKGRWVKVNNPSVICLCVMYMLNDASPRYPSRQSLDGVMKWKHFSRYWPFVWGIHRSPVKSPHKGHWRGALMFSLICVWINNWENNCGAGDLRRYGAHYDVIVMYRTLTSGLSIYRKLLSEWHIEKNSTFIETFR